MLPLLLVLTICIFASPLQATNAPEEVVCDQSKLASELADRLGKVEAQNGQVDLKELATIIVRLSPKKRAEWIRDLCAEGDGKKMGKSEMEECIQRRILRGKGNTHARELVQSLLIPRTLILAEMLKSGIEGHKQGGMDPLVEVVMGNSKAALREAAALYGGEGALVADIQGRFASLGGKNGEALKILVGRVQQSALSKRQRKPAIGSQLASYVRSCVDTSRGFSSHEAVQLLKYSADLDELKAELEHMFVHAEPAEYAELAHQWLFHCTPIMLNDDEFETHFRVHNDFMAFSALYFEQKLDLALKKKNYAEITQFVATRLNVDLKRIVESAYGTCSAGNQSQLKTAKDTVIELLGHQEKEYVGVLSAVFESIYGDCYAEKGEQEEREMDSEGDSCPATPSKYAWLFQRADTVPDEERLKKVGKVVADRVRKYFGVWCQKIEKSGLEAEDSAKAQQNELAEELCARLNESGQQESIAEVFVKFLAGIKRNESKMSALNELLKEHQCRNCQPLISAFLALPMFSDKQHAPPVRMIRKIANPNDEGSVTAADIEALEKWNSENTAAIAAHEVQRRHKRGGPLSFVLQVVVSLYALPVIVEAASFVLGALVLCPLSCLMTVFGVDKAVVAAGYCAASIILLFVDMLIMLFYGFVTSFIGMIPLK